MHRQRRRNFEKICGRWFFTPFCTSLRNELAVDLAHARLSRREAPETPSGRVSAERDRVPREPNPLKIRVRSANKSLSTASALRGCRASSLAQA